MSYWGLENDQPKFQTRLFACGVFKMEVVTIKRTEDGKVTISIEADDRSAWVRENIWKRRRVIKPKNYDEVLTEILESRYPRAIYSWDEIEFKMPKLFLGEDERNDPWEDMRGVVPWVGLRVFPNAFGRFVTAPIPDPEEGEPVWVYRVNRGDDSKNNIASDSRILNVREAYNGVILEFEKILESGDSRILRASAWDERRRSPTRRSGPLGERPFREKITPFFGQKITKPVLEQMAKERLHELLGGLEEVTASILPNPAHEVGDIVEIVDDDTGISDVHALEGFSIDLVETGPMEVRTRAGRVRD